MIVQTELNEISSNLSRLVLDLDWFPLPLPPPLPRPLPLPLPPPRLPREAAADAGPDLPFTDLEMLPGHITTGTLDYAVLCCADWWWKPQIINLELSIGIIIIN